MPVQPRASVAQGQPDVFSRWLWRGLLLLCVGLVAPGAWSAGCPGPAVRFEPLGPGVWLVPAAAGEADAVNRGQVSNLVVVREPMPGGGSTQARWWTLGSGPSPVFGRALACQLRQQLGGQITDAVSPWARPELVLGVRGLARAGAVRHWAHAAVADAMAEQCPRCVERLRLRLGSAAADLAGLVINLPDHRLQGEQGRLGPFDWWRLPRADGRWITVWRVREQALWVAHGLLDGNGPPDGRDADLALMRQSSRQLAALAAADGPAARFVGEQGGVMDSAAATRQADYWDALLAQVTTAVTRGDDEAAPAPGWPGLAPGWATHPWHSFNWQRGWRQVESQVMGVPAR